MNLNKLFLLIFLSLGMVSGTLHADEIDDLFGRGKEGETLDFQRFSEENIMEAISHDAGIACKDGLCTISAITSKYKEVVIDISGGLGSGGNNSGYGGYGNNGGGTNINFNTNEGGSEPRDRTHASLNIQLKVGDCETKIKVPRSLYYAMNKYIYGLLTEDASVRRSFTPADEAMIVFYTTISKYGNGCK